MIPLSDFIRFVAPYAQSVPDTTAETYIRQAARTFCERTRLWRDVREIDVVGDEDEIVPVPPQADIHEIENAWFKTAGSTQYSGPLDRVSFGDIDPNLLPTGMEMPASGNSPIAISQVTPQSIVLAPASVGTLRLSLFLTPSMRADALPRFLFDKYAAVLADGALAEILMLPDMPFVNLDVAAARAGRFNSAIDSKFNSNKRGQQRAPARTRGSYF